MTQGVPESSAGTDRRALYRSAIVGGGADQQMRSGIFEDELSRLASENSALSPRAADRWQRTQLHEAIRYARKIAQGLKPRGRRIQRSLVDWIPIIAEGRVRGDLEVEPFETWEAQWEQGVASAVMAEGEESVPLPLTLVLDLSDSMREEKLRAVVVTLAIAAHFDWSRVEVMGFSFEAEWFKRGIPSMAPQFSERFVRRILDRSGQGYTHLELALQELRRVHRGRRAWGGGVSILISDLQVTAGRDPAYLAPGVQPLWVLWTEPQTSSAPPRVLALAQALARGGGWVQVPDLEALPKAMARVVRLAARRYAR